MKVTLTTAAPETVKADALVLLEYDGELAAGKLPSTLETHAKPFLKAIATKTSRAEWFCTLERDTPVATRHLLLDANSLTPPMPPLPRLMTTAARAVATCRQHSLARVAFLCPERDTLAFVRAVVEGAGLGDFQDDRYRSANGKRVPLDLVLVLPRKDDLKRAAALVDRTKILLEATNVTRVRVNAPNNLYGPLELAADAQTLARHLKVKCEVLDEKELQRQGYGMITAVGGGSAQPARLIELSYSPQKVRKDAPRVVIVGKGVCFDTGGLCIKTADNMHTMNGDMAGAAATLGAFEAIVRLKLPIRVTAIIPAVINDISASAYRPGSILTSKSGKTVYVENTDAEGRLILADAFARAARLKPDVMIDVATLTGSAANALGHLVAAYFTADEELAQVVDASQHHGEHAWRLPLVEEYGESLKHPLADLRNIGNGPRGGAITAALFLRHFVPEGARWLHFDMSAPARAQSATRYFSPGATGWGVRLLTEVVEKLAK